MQGSFPSAGRGVFPIARANASGRSTDVSTLAPPPGLDPLASSWICVDLDAYRNNVRAILGRLTHGAALLAVVKADAYGHGAVPIARTVLRAGAQRLGVARIKEGVDLREAGIDAPIQLLGSCPPDHLPAGIEYDLTFAVSSSDEIRMLADRARAANQGLYRGRRTKVHLKIDTGMGRGGFAPDEVWPAAEQVLAEKTLDMEGAFTHFSSADEADPAPTLAQVALFRKLLRDLEERGVRFRVRHMANSAATAFYPESQLDLVRCGAILHGLRTWPASRDGLALKPTLSWHTRIVHLAKRPAGWTVGYSRLYRCERDSVLATLPVGYRDGYRRALTGKGEVLIRGLRLPVAGTISMDYLVVDVTPLMHSTGGLPEVGEVVTLIGSQGAARIGIEEMAEASSTIPYVVTTQLSADVKRFYQDGAAGVGQSVEPELRHVAPPRAVPLRPAKKPDEDAGSRRMAAGA